MTAPTPPPDRPDIPALLALLTSWVAEHRDTISRAYLVPRPGEAKAVVVVDNDHDYRETSDILARLERTIERDSRFGGINFLARYQLSSVEGFDPDAIVLDDPDAAHKIADRLRTADDLRAELARVAGERDAALAILRKVADEQIIHPGIDLDRIDVLLGRPPHPEAR